MALIVSEMAGVARRGPANTVPIAEQSVAIGASSTQSGAFNARTNMIRVMADAACHIAIGSDPTATTGKFPLAANMPEWFEVQPTHKIAAIQA